MPVVGRDEATRYLCAAVHLDSKLAEDLVEKVLEEPLRGVARSPGVDLVAVMKHVVAARARHLTRDVALVVALLLMFVCLVAGTFLPFLLVFVLSWVVVFTEAYVARWGALAHTLRRGSFDASQAPQPRRTLTKQQIDLVAAYAAGNVTAYSGFDPFLGHGWSLDSWSFALDANIPDDPDEPVDPFTVTELHDWVAECVGRLDFPGLGVHDRLFINGADIHHDARFLTGPQGAGRPVERVSDAVIRYLMEHPEDRARPYLAIEIVGWDGQLVYTLFLRLSLTSTHLFVEASHTLLPPLNTRYYEIDDLLLRPSVRQFLRLVFRCGFQWFGMMVRCLPRAARQVFADFRRARKEIRQRRVIARQFTFNHGALISVREAASDVRSRVPDHFPSLGLLDPILGPVVRTVLRLVLDSGGFLLGYHRYFQILDKEMYTKVVEKRIFDSLVEFLEQKNIDAGELKRRVETIVNNSVSIGDNNTISGAAFSVGKGARATASAGRPTSRAGS
ncbi:hypothetical protein [Streptacidiphilus sp. MAP12-20]|uniref:hypothetical protein n=1 Tax=Streptacidiphilus sp. MAP12-20 TaxID=3156299 RepID=UPI0035114672